MFRIYLSAMLLLVMSGIIFAVSATSAAALGAGLIFLSVGAGGISAGLMSRDTNPTAPGFSSTTTAD